MTTILLVRHGETDWNLQRRVQGHSDTPLNDNGRAQALALADTLDDVELDAVYASDLARAFDTARILAYTTLALVPAIVFYLFAERQLVGGLTQGSVKG